MRAYALAGADQRAKVWLAGGINGRGHSDDDKVCKRQVGRLGGVSQMLRGAHVCHADRAARVHVLAALSNLLFSQVKAYGGHQLAKGNCQRQADIAQANNGHNFCAG